MSTKNLTARSPIQKAGIALLITFAVFHFSALAWSIIPRNELYTSDIKTVIEPLKNAESVVINLKKNLSDVYIFQLFNKYLRFFRLEQNWGFFGGNFERKNSSIGVRVLVAESTEQTETWKWLYLEPSFNVVDVNVEPEFMRFSFFEPKLATDIIDNLNRTPQLAEHLSNYFIREFRKNKNEKIIRAETVLLTWEFKSFEDISSVKISNAQERVIYESELP